MMLLMQRAGLKILFQTKTMTQTDVRIGESRPDPYRDSQREWAYVHYSEPETQEARQIRYAIQCRLFPQDPMGLSIQVKFQFRYRLLGSP